jgi:hypothetical protein
MSGTLIIPHGDSYYHVDPKMFESPRVRAGMGLTRTDTDHCLVTKSGSDPTQAAVLPFPSQQQTRSYVTLSSLNGKARGKFRSASLTCMLLCYFFS